MKTALQFVAVILLAVVAGCVIIVTSDVHKAMKQTSGVMANVDGAITDLRTTTKKLNSTLDNVTQVTSQLELVASDERQYWNKTSEESAKAMRDLRQITARLDRSVNDKLIPDVDKAIGATAVSAQDALDSLQNAGETLSARLNDPAVADLATHLDAAAAGLATASGNVADGTAHLDHATADIEQSVHRLTRPPSLLKSIGMTLLDVGAKLGSIAAGFVR